MANKYLGRHQIFWGYFVVVLFLSSCKSAKIDVDGAIDENLSSRAVIRNHYNNQNNFKTLSGKARITYSDGESSQEFTVSLRMERDKAIWISAPMGVVKAYITPNRVTFYNKLNNEYFDGDFSYFSTFLGVELNFVQIQNVLLGRAIFNLKDEKYSANFDGQMYVLKPRQPMALFKSMFRIDPRSYMVASQILSQPLKKRMLDIEYGKYQSIGHWILPDKIGITALDGDSKNTINLEYRNMQYNRPLTFPYRIPKGFKEIVLK
ncbi:DUF4292 domain-containing protein [Flavobacteriaceae bacterium F89]|uniref:DUF4292 domain-containing protein n=1 Tax=Cerina litoralis TaxID=2874477 RepID=A0AAE3EVF4_9FLAO|nr:DUF4292 domain-containing protein [Cerina litoralis]MCG2460929.1 DUF4292 domain-containing protein [Cerina litoralis]